MEWETAENWARTTFGPITLTVGKMAHCDTWECWGLPETNMGTRLAATDLPGAQAEAVALLREWVERVRAALPEGP